MTKPGAFAPHVCAGSVDTAWGISFVGSITSKIMALSEKIKMPIILQFNSSRHTVILMICGHRPFRFYFQ